MRSFWITYVTDTGRTTQKPITNVRDMRHAQKKLGEHLKYKPEVVEICEVANPTNVKGEIL
jgi:hypothetical protein